LKCQKNQDKLRILLPSVSVGVVSADLLNPGEKIKRIEALAAKLPRFDIKEV
jgi:hypothetical protein